MNIEKLEDILDRFDIVLLITDKESFKLVKMMIDLEMLDSTPKNLAFLTVEPIDMLNERHLVYRIDEAEMKDIMDIYCTYEVSDKLVSLSVSDVHGGLWNYVKSGLLSREDMIRAIIM